MRFAAAAVLGLLSASGWSQNVVEYDHLSGEDQTFTAEVEPGNSFLLKVNNTCPDSFSYEFKGFVPGDPSVVRDSTPPLAAAPSCPDVFTDEQLRGLFATERDQRLKVGGYCAAKQKVITIDHLAKFNAYLVDIRHKAGTPNKAVSTAELKRLEDQFIKEFRVKQAAVGTSTGCDQIRKDVHDSIWKSVTAQELKSTAVIVSIDRTGINIDLAGGATVSWLTNPQFALVTRTSGEPPISQQVVVRDRGAEDDYRLGLAGFIHSSHSRFPNVALSLGFGLEEDNTLNYLIGASWRLSSKVFVTAGVNFASVDRLPAGQQLDQPPNDANVLSNLSSRTDSAFFVAFSYSFLSPGQGFFTGKLAVATKDSE
jgi:hypothetical protein